MIRNITRVLILSVLLAVSGPVLAVEPDEVLKDPALEARARALSAELRCLVCQNQSIDDSNAPLARDLRLLLRERLAAGDTDEQVKRFLVERYGTFVLLKPPFDGRTIFLWLAPVLMLAGAGALIVRHFGWARRAPAEGDGKLTREEEEKLQHLLAEADGPLPSAEDSTGRQ